MKSVKPKTSSRLVDKTCKNYIEKKNYEKYFIHSTGSKLDLRYINNQKFHTVVLGKLKNQCILLRQHKKRLMYSTRKRNRLFIE